MKYGIKRCAKCALPETFPGTDFYRDETCNYCSYFDTFKEIRRQLKENMKEQFIEIIEKTKNKGKKYDCIVCYSGGKDSTYLLMELQKRFKLRILSCTLDNGYLSQKAVANIKRMTKKLNISHIMFKPEQHVVNKVFKAALTRKIIYPKEITSLLSPLCATCQGMILSYAFNLAMRENIPTVFIGFTPGQYPDISYENFVKSRSCIFFSNSIYKDDPPDIIKIIRDPINEIIGEEAEKYFLKSQYLEKGQRYPHILFPFHSLFEYSEQKIYDSIMNIGWEKPDDTDACSTNCLINTLSNFAFMLQYGYHPYIAEISMMIREGYLSYNEGLRLEKFSTSGKAMKISLSKLGITEKDICR